MSKFQQRHYEAVADLLRQLPDPSLGMTAQEIERRKIEAERTTQMFVLMFRADNAKFKPSLFLKRAGYTD